MFTYKFGYQITDCDGNPSLSNPQPVSSLLECLRSAVASYRKALDCDPHANIQVYISCKPDDADAEDEAELNFHSLSSGIAVWAGTGHETDFTVPRPIMLKIFNALRDRTSHTALLADELIRLSTESYRSWVNQATTK